VLAGSPVFLLISCTLFLHFICGVLAKLFGMTNIVFIAFLCLYYWVLSLHWLVLGSNHGRCTWNGEQMDMRIFVKAAVVLFYLPALLFFALFFYILVLHGFAWGISRL